MEYPLFLAKEDHEQIYYHTINLAFLSLVNEEDKQSMREYAQQALTAANAEGVVQFSETSDGDKENYFHIYKGGFDDETNTPEVGQYIISLADNIINSSLVGGDEDSENTIKKDEIAIVLQVQNVNGVVFCKISFHLEGASIGAVNEHPKILNKQGKNAHSGNSYQCKDGGHHRPAFKGLLLCHS